VGFDGGFEEGCSFEEDLGASVSGDGVGFLIFLARLAAVRFFIFPPVVGGILAYGGQ